MSPRLLAASVAALALACCGAPDAKLPVNSKLDARLLEVARGYLEYGRVDDQNRWSPTLCALHPSHARFSGSGDEATHGRKIYFLFARDRDAYVGGIKSPQPEGQVIVKEAWQPVPVVESEVPRRHATDAGGNFEPDAVLDGKVYTTGARSGLFIMLKRDGAWTYATVTADASRVIQSGQIASCLSCHRDAKPDSLFGLPTRTKDR